MDQLRVGDVCRYRYDNENKSDAIVKIVEIVNQDRGIAKIKFLEVIVDDTGNGLFNYLLRTEKTMNASFCYMEKIV